MGTKEKLEPGYRYGENFRVVTIGHLRRIAKLMESVEPVVMAPLDYDETVATIGSSIASQVADSLEEKILEDQARPPVEHYWQCHNCNSWNK